MRRSMLARLMALALAVSAVTGMSLVLTAANSVPATKAGDGSNTISGYAVTGVHYTLNSTDPSKIDQVAFTVDSAPGVGSTLKAQLVAGGSWYSCSNTGTAVTCATTSPQATVAPSDALRVVIAD